jgi:hypothetical protein
MTLWTQRSWLVWFVAVGATHIAGCGGSSSETPEPAQPESWQLKLRHQRQLSLSKAEGPNLELNSRESVDDTAPPPSTWGVEGKKQRVVTKPTTTLVLPEPLPGTDEAMVPSAPTPATAPAPSPTAKGPTAAKSSAPDSTGSTKNLRKKPKN